MNETGAIEVPAGRQRFYTRSRDNGASELSDERNAQLLKDWFYGAYSAEADEDNPPDSDYFKSYEGVGTDNSVWTRQMASGRYDSPNSYWWQHDYFVHDGTVDTDSTEENGDWLRRGAGTPPRTVDSTGAGCSSSTTVRGSSRRS